VFLYRLLSGLALLVYSPWALLRSLTGRRKLGDLRGRLGLTAWPDLAGGIWVHAVSVGEVGVARNLLAELSRRLPGTRLGLSVTTAAGRDAARRLAGEGIAIFSFPLDFAWPIEKALEALRPGLILLTETEIWPLLLHRAGARGIPVALVNGRISARSFRRYLLVGRWFARVLEGVAAFAMQSREDADRITQLGASSDRVLVTGNIKYDVPPPALFADASRLTEAAGGRAILVAASTGDGEEAIVLDAWKGLVPRPLLVIAPRRPERFDEAARLIESRGFILLRRSQPDPRLSDPAIDNRQSSIVNPDVYLLDSIGELAALYRHAFLAFIGGSLVTTGGHNPIEAWAEGVAVVVGPHTQNIREIAASGQRLGILERVGGAQDLARAFVRAVEDPASAARRGEAARRFVSESRGAAARTADVVAKLLAPGSPARSLSRAPGAASP
jgi:3-deoxy-D-manno-octulosonic-acid transferase